MNSPIITFRPTPAAARALAWAVEQERRAVENGAQITAANASAIIRAALVEYASKRGWKHQRGSGKELK